MNREILSEVLGGDYDYLFAGNGLQALEQLSQNPDVDLMLLDIRMPQLDGFGVLNILKQRRVNDEIPVIVISAEEDVSIIQKAYDLGAVDYINRPFNLAIVQRRVRNTLLLYARQKQLVHLVESRSMSAKKTTAPWSTCSATSSKPATTKPAPTFCTCACSRTCCCIG